MRVPVEAWLARENSQCKAACGPGLFKDCVSKPARDKSESRHGVEVGAWVQKPWVSSPSGLWSTEETEESRQSLGRVGECGLQVERAADLGVRRPREASTVALQVRDQGDESTLSSSGAEEPSPQFQQGRPAQGSVVAHPPGLRRPRALRRCQWG